MTRHPRATCSPRAVLITVALFLCLTGCAERVQGTNMMNMKDQNMGGATDLHWAASGGQVETARALLDRGADVNAANSYGQTPLHFAVWNIHTDTEMVTLLLERGADAAATDNWGRTPAQVAREVGSVRAAEILERAASSSERPMPAQAPPAPTSIPSPEQSPPPIY